MAEMKGPPGPKVRFEREKQHVAETTVVVEQLEPREEGTGWTRERLTGRSVGVRRPCRALSRTCHQTWASHLKELWVAGW